MKNINETKTATALHVTKIAGAVALGTMAGAVLGVLFAPDKGTETRSKVLNSARGMANNLTQKVKDKTHELTSRFRKVNEEPDRLDNMTPGFKKKLAALKS